MHDLLVVFMLMIAALFMFVAVMVDSYTVIVAGGDSILGFPDKHYESDRFFTFLKARFFKE